MIYTQYLCLCRPVIHFHRISHYTNIKGVHLLFVSNEVPLTMMTITCGGLPFLSSILQQYFFSRQV